MHISNKPKNFECFDLTLLQIEKESQLSKEVLVMVEEHVKKLVKNTVFLKGRICIRK